MGASARRYLLTVAGGLALASCSYVTPATDDNQSTVTTTTDSDAGPEVEPVRPTTTAVLPDPLWQDVLLELVPIAELDQPIAMSARSGSPNYYVAERGGLVRVVERRFRGSRNVESISVESRPMLDLSEEVSLAGEGGLLGLEFSTDGRQLYVSYTDSGGDLVIAEFDVSNSERADMESRNELLRIPQPANNHNGGSLALGPDGFLYVGVGDGGGSGDPDGNGQNTETLLGSVLRIDPLTPGDVAYGIPDGNPFVDEGGRPEIWAYGLRNPWRFSFDRDNGDLWIADVGQEAVEEVNLLAAATGGGRGANLGWNAVEGDQMFRGEAPADHVLPVYTYRHEQGRCSIIGGYVYRGEEIPLLDGVYLFGDFCTGEILGLENLPDGVVVRELGISTGAAQLVSFGETLEGEILVLERQGPEGTGVVYRLEPGEVTDEEE